MKPIAPADTSPKTSRARWRRIRSRVFLVAAMAALSATVAAGPYSGFLTRVGYDFLLPVVRSTTVRAPEAARDVVLIMEDEVTHNTPPFDVIPAEAWGPHFASVLNAIADHDPAVIGFDIIFQKTVGVRELMPRYDIPFLRALRRLREGDQVILGEVRLSDQEVRPHQGQLIAAGDTNTRSNVVVPDMDAVSRSYDVATALTDGTPVTTFGAELGHRAGVAVPEKDFLIDFRWPPTFPIYRFSDLYHCAQAGDAQTFSAFADKVIVFGTVLDVEDRHIAADRFVADKIGDATPLGCSPNGGLASKPEPYRVTTPGVYLHLRSIAQILSGSRIDVMDPPIRAAIGALLGAALAMFFSGAKPVVGVIALFAAAAGVFMSSVVALRAGSLAPWVAWAGGGGLVFVVTYAYRLLVEGKEKRAIRHAFQHYLAPSLVQKLADDPDALSLGGERREAAIFFSDLAGFTTLSEKLADEPETLVQVTNMNLAMVAEAIERNGGYVDKFIGDAVMAVWGAPVEVDDPATRAATAAIEAMAGLKETNARLPKPDLPAVDMRIGINLGTVIAGNMGSERRLNYTIVGDPVNLAARLEPACKVYSIHILAGEDLAHRLDSSIVSRCVDYVAVKGKVRPVKVFEIMGFRAETSHDELDRLARFQEGLEMYWARRFEEAEKVFAELADGDTVAKLYVDRTRRFRAEPPPEDWDGSVAFMTK